MEIASRALTLQNGIEKIAIPVRIYAPQQREARAWSCRYEIGWPEGKESREVWGIDSVQAILIALQAAGADIYTSAYHKSGNLQFEAPARGYGFPVPSSLRDLLVGDDTKFV